MNEKFSVDLTLPDHLISDILEGVVSVALCKDNIVLYWCDFVDDDGESILYGDMLGGKLLPVVSGFAVKAICKWLCRACHKECEGVGTITHPSMNMGGLFLSVNDDPFVYDISVLSLTEE